MPKVEASYKVSSGHLGSLGIAGWVEGSFITYYEIAPQKVAYLKGWVRYVQLINPEPASKWQDSMPVVLHLFLPLSLRHDCLTGIIDVLGEGSAAYG